MEKRATVTVFTNSPNDAFAENWFGELQEHLLKALNDPKVKRETLGGKEIDGCPAIGYRLVMNGCVIVLWGDPRTGLPIRIEKSFAADPEGKTVMTDFVFNMALDKSLFSLDPPAGYVVSRRRVDGSVPGEKDLVESLRYYSDLFGGVFPDSFVVNDRTMNPVMEKIVLKNGWKTTPQAQPSRGNTQALSESLLKVVRGFGFAVEQLANADSHYAGNGVSRGAANVPIFWYRPQNTKCYRVIYADLSVRDADEPPSSSNPQPVPGRSGAY